MKLTMTVGKEAHKERDANIYGQHRFVNPSGFTSATRQSGTWEGDDYIVTPQGLKAFRFKNYRNAQQGDEVEVSRE
jgi:hypothetical protein